MSAKTFLFTGEESYLLAKEIKRRKASFAGKYGKDNIKEYSPANFSLMEISNDLFGSGLFAEKKLVIIYGIPDDTFAPHKIPAGLTSELAAMLEKKRDQINPDAIVIFVSYTPDKRKKLYKFLTGHVAKHQECKKLKGKSLLKFFREEADGLLTDDTARYCIERIGTNIERLMRELDKLRVYCSVHEITQPDQHVISRIIYGDVQADSFALLDTMYKDPQQSLLLVDAMREDGINRNQVSGTMMWGVRILVLYIDCLKRKVNAKAIPKELGVHPFVIMKHSKYYELLLQKEMKISFMLRQLIATDFQVKSGIMPDTMFWLQLKRMILALQ